MTYLGIDVSKLKLDCALLVDAINLKCKSKKVVNTPEGVQSLLQWCVKQGVQAGQLHVVLEATGRYHEGCAQALYDAGVTVSIVNPAQVRDLPGRWHSEARLTDLTAWHWRASGWPCAPILGMRLHCMRASCKPY